MKRAIQKKETAVVKRTGFELGNQHWRKRSKHGRDRLFESPLLLWEAACEYFDWSSKNPWMKNEALKGGDNAGMIIKVPTERPYTLQALCYYLGCNTLYFRDFKESIKDRTDDESRDFSLVITHVEEIIYAHKYEGAAVGAFNANIIARDLGLRENTDHTTDGKALNALPWTYNVIVEAKKNELEG